MPRVIEISIDPKDPSSLDFLLTAIEGELTAVQGRSGDMVAERARELAPVNTGALQGAIQSNGTGEVNVPLDYALGIEIGRPGRDATPFLVPALIEIEAFFIEDLIGAIIAVARAN